jgi:hypothetical protein
MEHVGNIDAAFVEMARVTKPGGAIYSVAAPLWRSQYGHHMTCFHGHPWAHLLFQHNDEIVAYARSHGIEGERGHSIEAIVAYMMDRRFFNQLPGAAYINACSALARTTILSNALISEPEDTIDHHNGRVLLSRGFAKGDLLAAAHVLEARRRGLSHRAGRFSQRAIAMMRGLTARTVRR